MNEVEGNLRLHITPFSKDLAQSILSTNSTIAVGTISHHTLETFPEHSYGYIELPTMEAEKLKRKLNGSILKGKKLQVENARPEKRGLEPEKDKGDLPSENQESRPPKRPRKARSELQGHELTSERKIKRGWTEPEKGNHKSSLNERTSSRVASKYTDKSECMFRVQLPPNKKDGSPHKTGNEKAQRTTKDKSAKVVHEFERSVKQPSFIRNETRTANVGVASKYVDGQGWIDKDGNVLEEEKKRQMRSRDRTDKSQRVQRRAEPERLSAFHTSASNEEQDSSSDTNGECKQAKDASITIPADATAGNQHVVPENVHEEETSSSGGSSSNSDSSSEPSKEEENGSESSTDSGSNAADVENPEQTKASPLGTSKASTAVHPLEALFKRPNQAASQTRNKRPLEINTEFNFFEPDEEQMILQTPFTTRDLQLRGLRSAAPTPDTALPTRRFFAESASPSSKNGFEDEADPDSPSDDILPTGEPNKKEGESEFAKWFWEHRGENNRAWKRRRRETMKEKRQREKKQKGSRIG
jgi:hypothetical protein